MLEAITYQDLITREPTAYLYSRVSDIKQTEENKKVAIQIECAAQLKTIILYKSMSKSISK